MMMVEPEPEQQPVADGLHSTEKAWLREAIARTVSLTVARRRREYGTDQLEQLATASNQSTQSTGGINYAAGRLGGAAPAPAAVAAAAAESVMGGEGDLMRTELAAAQAELRSTARVSELIAAELECAQAQLAEERVRHESSRRESEESRARLSEQLSASLTDLALARDGTQALIEEMKQWNHFKAVVTCQRILRRREDARRFRSLLRGAVRHQRTVSALEASLQESRQHAKEHEAQTKAELELMHAACLDTQTKLSAAEAETRLNADLAAQAAIETAAVRRQLENVLHSSSMSEARRTDELSTLHMKLSAAQAEAKSNAEAAARASADAQSAWSANAETRAHWEQIQTESEVARTELQAELQRSAATHAAQVADLQMQIATVEASARSEIQAAARNQESALRGELSTLRAASFTAETELKQQTEKVAQLRLESREALRAFADGEAAQASATEERDIHEQARQDAEAKCLEMESSLRQEKATMQSLLSAVETKLTDADRQMSLITAQALQDIANQEAVSRRIKETMDHRLVRASLRRLCQCTLAKTISAWQTWANRQAQSRRRMQKVQLRIQNLILASALHGWHESVTRAVRLRIVCETAIKRMQNSAKAWVFTALWNYRCRKKQKKLDQQDQALMIAEMHEMVYARAVETCQRAVRRKQDAKRLKVLAQEAAFLRLQVAQMEYAASEADEAYASQLSEATATLQSQLVEQDESFRVEIREMQKSLIDAERALVEKQQFEETSKQLQAQSAAELLEMQEDLLAQAEALIADKEQLKQREATVVRREAGVSPAFAEIDSIKEALASERAERAKDRVARQRLEEESRKQIARETDLTKQVHALQRRVQEQQRLLARVQGKKAAIDSVPQPRPADSKTDGHQNVQSPTRPRRGSPEKRQAGATGGIHPTQKSSTSIAATDQPQTSWVGPYKPHEARSPLAAEERKAQGKAMLWSHGTAATRAKSTPSAAADQPQTSWVGPYRPHEARSPLPVEERKAQGKAMLWSHGTAAARAAAAAAKDMSLQSRGTREEIRSLSSMLEAQVQVQTEAEVNRQAAEAALAERLAAEEATAARAQAVALLKQGVRLDIFFATGKLKHERVFWLGPTDPTAGQATLSWGRIAHAAPRSSKTEILRSVTDGPCLAAPGDLFDALDKDCNGSLDGPEVAALYRQARGEKLSKKALAKALADMDEDGSGTVGRDEFLKWWADNAASDLERQRDRSLTVALGDAAGGGPSDESMLLRLVAPTVQSKDQILLGLTTALGGSAVSAQRDGCT